jgi:hypothetical protein
MLYLFGATIVNHFWRIGTGKFNQSSICFGMNHIKDATTIHSLVGRVMVKRDLPSPLEVRPQSIGATHFRESGRTFDGYVIQLIFW